MEQEFYPPRSAGLLIQVVLILVMAGVGGYFFFLASTDPSGLDFLLHMLIALAALAPLPLIVYRLWALLSGVYYLRRDGLLIRWGLRREDIPLRNIQWMRPAAELGFRLPLPWLRWPGAILGIRTIQELGRVEYLASDLQHMILVATPEKVYAVSPENQSQFITTFLRMNELGSLDPIEAQSVYPTVLIGRVWEDRLARLLILSSFGIGILLLGIVGFAVPALDTIIWTGGGTPAPAERLLLLPILDGLIWFFNLLFGIFLFRRGTSMQIAAYLLWGASGLTGVLLLVGSLLLIL